MTEQFVQAMLRVIQLIETRNIEAASGALEKVCEDLFGLDSETLERLSESELFARIIGVDTPLVAKDKIGMVVAWLRQRGRVYAAAAQSEQSNACFLRALHLLLEVMREHDSYEFPEFVPKVEELLAELKSSSVPSASWVALMHHYEQTGQFAKAEDALYELAEAESQNAAVLELGRGFYERLRRQHDEALELGNLPRKEVEAGYKEFEALYRPGTSS